MIEYKLNYKYSGDVKTLSLRPSVLSISALIMIGSVIFSVPFLFHNESSPFWLMVLVALFGIFFIVGGVLLFFSGTYVTIDKQAINISHKGRLKSKSQSVAIKDVYGVALDRHTYQVKGRTATTYTVILQLHDGEKVSVFQISEDVKTADAVKQFIRKRADVKAFTPFNVRHL